MTSVLGQHLDAWIGPDRPVSGARAVANPRLDEPSWDGRPVALRGIRDSRRLLLGVRPDHVAEVQAVLDAAVARRDPAGLMGDADLGAALVAVVGNPWGEGRRVALGAGVFRYSHAPTALAPTGTWVEASDPRLPAWLRPFNGGVLAAFDGHGRYLAGVGRKVHDRRGHEIAVGTTPAARGRGLARRLVVTASRRIIAEGAIPTYLHEESNVASARVADAAGFPDRRLWVVGLWPSRWGHG